MAFTCHLAYRVRRGGHIRTTHRTCDRERTFHISPHDRLVLHHQQSTPQEQRTIGPAAQIAPFILHARWARIDVTIMDLMRTERQRITRAASITANLFLLVLTLVSMSLCVCNNLVFAFTPLTRYLHTLSVLQTMRSDYSNRRTRMMYTRHVLLIIGIISVLHATSWRTADAACAGTSRELRLRRLHLMMKAASPDAHCSRSSSVTT